MNIIYVISVLMYMTLTFIFDFPKLKKATKGDISLYAAFGSASLILFSLALLTINVQMPTKLITGYIVPGVMEFMNIDH